MATQPSTEQSGFYKAFFKWFQGMSVSNIDKGPELVNADYIESINAAGTARVSMIGLDASNVTQLPNGASIPTGKTLVVTDAGGVSIGGVVPPSRIHQWFNTAAGAAAGDYDGVYMPGVPWQLTSLNERHGTAGTDAGAVTVMAKKVPSGTAKAAGTDMLSAGLNMKAVADTAQAGALHATVANLQGTASDGIGFVLTGTGTALDAVSISYALKLI